MKAKLTLLPVQHLARSYQRADTHHRLEHQGPSLFFESADCSSSTRRSASQAAAAMLNGEPLVGEPQDEEMEELEEDITQEVHM